MVSRRPDKMIDLCIRGIFMPPPSSEFTAQEREKRRAPTGCGTPSGT